MLERKNTMNERNDAIRRLALTGLLCLSTTAMGAKNTEPSQTPAKSSKEKVGQGKEETPPLERTLMSLDGMPITTQNYLHFLQGNPSIMLHAKNSEIGKMETLKEMLRQYLLQKAIYDEGLIGKDVKEPSPKMVTDAYVQLSKKHFPAPPIPDDKEAYAYYQAHTEDYGVPASFRVNQILFKTPTSPEPAVLKAAEERAEQALKRLSAGEKFSALAGELTENPIGKLTGGDIGFVEPHLHPWMEGPLKGMKAGDRTGPIKSPEGVVILEVTDIRPAIVAPYANVRDKVIKAMRDESQKKVRDAYVSELSKKAKIEVIAPEIKQLFPEGVQL